MTRVWFCPFLLTVVFATGCADEQCIETRLRYAGSAEGPVYVYGETESGRDRTGMQFESVEMALAWAGEDSSIRSEGCSSGGDYEPEPWTFRAWIDVNDVAREPCDWRHGDREACAPQPDDPQGSVTTTLGAGRHVVLIEIEDP